MSLPATFMSVDRGSDRRLEGSFLKADKFKLKLIKVFTIPLAFAEALSDERDAKVAAMRGDRKMALRCLHRSKLIWQDLPFGVARDRRMDNKVQELSEIARRAGVRRSLSEATEPLS